MGNVSNAQIMLDQVYQAQQKVLGPSHPDTMWTAAAIGRLQSSTS
jgi:hypothetical protein